MWGLLKRRDFRGLYLGMTFSRIGDTMTFVVISWIALNAGGPRAVGLVVFAGGAVTPFSGPVIGQLLDRFGLRLMMLGDNLGRGLLMLGLAGLVSSGHVRVDYLIAFSIAAAALSPATELGQGMAIPMILGSEDLESANMLMSSSWDLAAWLGPGFAGLAMNLIGYTPVLLIDATTFFLMAAAGTLMPGRQEQPGEEANEPGSALGRLFLGFRLLWQLRTCLVLTLVALGDLFLGGMMEAYLPAFSKLAVHGGPATYGLLVSLAGVGCLCGTMLLTPVVIRLGYARALVVVLAARGLLILPLAAAGSWWLAIVILLVASVPDGSFFPITRTVQQRLIPAEYRGRVAGAKSALGVAGFPLGAAAAGLLVAGIGTGPTAVVMGLGYLPLALLVGLTVKQKDVTRPESGAQSVGIESGIEPMAEECRALAAQPQPDEGNRIS
jgi:predicted MFS family arabinose efflux permease